MLEHKHASLTKPRKHKHKVQVLARLTTKVDLLDGEDLFFCVTFSVLLSTTCSVRIHSKLNKQKDELDPSTASPNITLSFILFLVFFFSCFQKIFVFFTFINSINVPVRKP
jgi:hypothetical protein